MKSSELLSKAKENLLAGTWIRGHLFGHKGYAKDETGMIRTVYDTEKMCAIGSVVKAELDLTGTMLSTNVPRKMTEDRVRATKILTEAIIARTDGSCGAIATYNDHICSSAGELLDVFDEAILRAKELESREGERTPAL